MGASSFNIVKILTFDFLRWVLISNLVAWPLIYFGMNKWLENFAYRTSIDLSPFIISGLIGFVIAFITISLQTVKAANSNPIESLQYE